MDSTQLLPLGILLGTVSLAIIGVIMAAGGFLPELSETAKRRIPGVIFGIILIILATVIVTTFANSVTP